MKAAGLRRRRQDPLHRLSLFGMGGTIGRGDIRHCSTWDIGDSTPGNAVERQDISEVVNVRRQESNTKWATEKKNHFNDIMHR